MHANARAHTHTNKRNNNCIYFIYTNNSIKRFPDLYDIKSGEDNRTLFSIQRIISIIIVWSSIDLTLHLIPVTKASTVIKTDACSIITITFPVTLKKQTLNFPNLSFFHLVDLLQIFVHTAHCRSLGKCCSIHCVLSKIHFPQTHIPFCCCC